MFQLGHAVVLNDVACTAALQCIVCFGSRTAHTLTSCPTAMLLVTCTTKSSL
jgi:hypothetical protein